VCRHLAYVGLPVAVGSLLLDAPHALVTQVDQPRCQLPGVTNRDGWGVAWRHGDEWALRRSTIPFSADHEGQAGLRTLVAPSIVAAIRRASPGAALTEAGNAPFVEGRWAFSLNGFVGGFFEGARDDLRAELTPARRDRLAGDADSEVLFGLVLDRIDGGHDPAAALGAVVDASVAAAGDQPSRLNLLLSDGVTIWASRWSNSLFTRRSAAGDVAVASEPWDDDPSWTEVPDRSVVTATPTAVAAVPLA
jgi:gamma-glutamyl hercynylcysteine S-oxide hydrolase